MSENYGVPICPVCWNECETIYTDVKTGDVVGCDVCLKAVNGWDWFDSVCSDEDDVRGDYEFEAEREKRFERRNDE